MNSKDFITLGLGLQAPWEITGNCSIQTKIPTNCASPFRPSGERVILHRSANHFALPMIDLLKPVRKALVEKSIERKSGRSNATIEAFNDIFQAANAEPEDTETMTRSSVLYIYLPLRYRICSYPI